MKKYFKIKYLIILLIVIQFYRPTKNISTEISKNNIFKTEIVPQKIQEMLKTSCFDCHSNNTKYPWYNNIAPASWVLANHVDDGKEELNFDAWSTYSQKRKNRKLKEIKKELEGKDMPLDSYLWIHKKAELSKNQIKEIIVWARKLYPDIDKKEEKNDAKSTL